MKLLTWSLLLPVLLIISCSTGQSIQNLNKPLRDLQMVADTSLPVGRKKVSRNGRVFTSKFFVVKEGKWVEHTNENLRHYAEIGVFGNRRPYSMNVNVYSQKRIRGAFSEPKENEALTRVLTRRVQQTLQGSGLDRNVIDDFRVF